MRQIRARAIAAMGIAAVGMIGLLLVLALRANETIGDDVAVPIACFAALVFAVATILTGLPFIRREPDRR